MRPSCVGLGGYKWLTFHEIFRVELEEASGCYFDNLEERQRGKYASISSITITASAAIARHDDYANPDNDKTRVLIAPECHDIYTCNCETNNGENITEQSCDKVTGEL